MKTITIVLLVIAATATVPAASQLSGKMKLIVDYGILRGNVGELEIKIDDTCEIEGHLIWNSRASLPPGVYPGYLHENPFNDVNFCQDTGRFLVTETGGVEAFIRPFDLIFYSGGRRPTLSIRKSHALNMESATFLLNRSIVFHTPDHQEWVDKGVDKVSPGLPETIALCGFLWDTTQY